MIFQPEIDSNFINSPNIKISQQELHSLINKIEIELQGSEIYCRTMAGLEKLLAETFETGQVLVKAVGQEAIRLTLKEIMANYSVIPIISEETDDGDKHNLNVSAFQEHHPTKTESTSHTNCSTQVTNLVDTNYLPSSSNRTIGKSKTNKKLDYRNTVSKAASEREMLLRQIGQQLRQIRQNHSLSVQELHAQTLVPVHQIRALEAGNIEQLPEDIYIRGFICKLGEALGINGVQLAASLAENERVTSTATSWFQKNSALKLHINSVHLYLGYIALIAGAIGGLSWISKPTTPNNYVELHNPSHSSISPQAEESINNSKPGLESSEPGIKAVVDITPPETTQFSLE
ncbi:MAG: hypothetical protein F6K16_17940 [Symploca sp. SIO2B6]|nr:hypothetical protein [Symploca sp. SIO2B6]